MGRATGDLGDEVARLLATLIRLQLPTQADAIREVARSGIGPARIADLFGTTANTVNVTLNKSRRDGDE